MAAINTVFKDFYYDPYEEDGDRTLQAQIELLGAPVDMKGTIDIPKRGYYNFRKLGWKGFNSKIQTPNKHSDDKTKLDFTGLVGDEVDLEYNPIIYDLEEEEIDKIQMREDHRCKHRTVYLTVTAVEDNSSIDLNFMLDPTAKIIEKPKKAVYKPVERLYSNPKYAISLLCISISIL